MNSIPKPAAHFAKRYIKFPQGRKFDMLFEVPTPFPSLEGGARQFYQRFAVIEGWADGVWCPYLTLIGAEGSGRSPAAAGSAPTLRVGGATSSHGLRPALPHTFRPAPPKPSHPRQAPSLPPPPASFRSAIVTSTSPRTHSPKNFPPNPKI